MIRGYVAGQVQPWGVAPDWRVDSVELGSRDRISTANLAFNRDPVLRGDVPDPFINQDTQYAIAFQEEPTLPPLFIFQGTASNLNRLISGQPGASSDTGSLELVDGATMYAADVPSQIAGRFRVTGHQVTSGTSTLVSDTALPCVFNAGGLPNRSVQTAADAGIFDPTSDPDMFYFLDDDGYGYHKNTGVPSGWSTRKARYWTYAQAIAYVLHFHAGASLPTSGGPAPTGIDPTVGVTRNLTTLWFGNPLTPINPMDPMESRDLIWKVIVGTDPSNILYKLESPGVVLEGEQQPPPTPPPFDTDPAVLLRKQANNVSIEGLNVIEALAVLLQGAGLGWWIDHRSTDSNNPTLPPDPYALKFKVWTPGGELNTNGVGSLFYPELQPYNQDISNQTDAQTLSVNNAKDLSINWDGAHIVNRPRVIMASPQFEVTAELRPGWPIIHDPNLFFLDNINKNASVLDASGTPHNEEALAYAEAHRAFSAWLANPEFYTDLSSDNADRVRLLSRIIHAKGDLNPNFPNVMRKWILPTDHRYPNSIYARDTQNLIANGMPSYYGKYDPVNFNDVAAGTPPSDTFMTFPIGIADNWPAKNYPLHPMLTTDSAGNSLGVQVELSFDGGASWSKWPSFTVLPDEFGIMLSFENPFDVVNPKKVAIGGAVPPWKQLNLISAYMTYNLRVRVTATIDSGQPINILPVAPGDLNRSQIILRRSRYKVDNLFSKNFGRTVEDPNAAMGPINPLDPAQDRLVYRGVNDIHAARSEANASVAAQANPRISAAITIPWVETDASPGSIVPFVSSTLPAGPPDPGGRQLDFRQLVDSRTLAPAIAGVIHTFDRGGQSSQLILEDWRAISAIGGL